MCFKASFKFLKFLFQFHPRREIIVSNNDTSTPDIENGKKNLYLIYIESLFTEALNKRYGKEDEHMEMKNSVLDRQTYIGEIEETYI